MDDTCNVKIEDGTCNVKVEDEVLNDFTGNECYMTYPSPTLGYVSGGNESEIKVKCEDNNSLLQDIKSESIADSNFLQQDIKSEAHPSFHATVVGSGISIGGDTDVKRETLSPSCSVVLRRLNKCPVRCDTYRITSGSLHCAHSIPDTEASEGSLQQDSSDVDDIDTSSIHSDSIKEPEAVQTSNGESEVLEAPINEENNHNRNKKRCRTGKGKKEKKTFSNNHSMKESMHKSETSSQLDIDHTEPKRLSMPAIVDVIREAGLLRFRCLLCHPTFDASYISGSGMRKHFRNVHSLSLEGLSREPSKEGVVKVRHWPYWEKGDAERGQVERPDLVHQAKRPGISMVCAANFSTREERRGQETERHNHVSSTTRDKKEVSERFSKGAVMQMLGAVGVGEEKDQEKILVESQMKTEQYRRGDAMVEAQKQVRGERQHGAEGAWGVGVRAEDNNAEIQKACDDYCTTRTLRPHLSPAEKSAIELSQDRYQALMIKCGDNSARERYTGVASENKEDVFALRVDDRRNEMELRLAAVFEVLMDVASTMRLPLSPQLLVRRGMQLCPGVPQAAVMRAARLVLKAWRESALAFQREWRARILEKSDKAQLEMILTEVSEAPLVDSSFWRE